jgi:phosphoserine aminotransferase
MTGRVRMADRVYNFAAGPSMLPLEVLERAGREITNYHGTGMSVMEMSHRSPVFQKIFDDAKNHFKKLMHVPEDYEVLFLQGGGSTQFSMVPLNFMYKTGKADYAVTGNFSRIAAEEASKYGQVHRAYDGKADNYTRIPKQEELVLDPQASYFHYCANNTIFGTEWNYVPETNGVPLICDMSSDITSRVVDISKYALIYAGAQKNVAPAGVTIVIVKKDLAGHEFEKTPLMLSYKRMIDKNSMHNTPPCWQIYMVGLVMDWLESQGGVEGMEKKKHAKAQLLYDVLDSSHLYKAHAAKDSRSDMNVTFRTGNEDLDAKFVSEAAENGLVNLKGHRLTGGIRASIYNAMPYEGVEKLRDFMISFEKENA